MVLRAIVLLFPFFAAGAAHAQGAAPPDGADAADLRRLARFKPFRNESQSVTLGELTVENRRDRIALYGSLVITRDKEGLALARSLKQLIDATVGELQAASLPDRVRNRPTDSVTSPFAED